jgi:hypothetical protein
MGVLLGVSRNLKKKMTNNNSNIHQQLNGQYGYHIIAITVRGPASYLLSASGFLWGRPPGGVKRPGPTWSHRGQAPIF